MAKKVIILTNLGSPDSTSTKDLKKYLNEFLMDERVIDLPKFLRTLLVKGIVVPIRASKSAKKYKSIWTDEGSPLVVTTDKLAKKVQSYSNLPTYVCMRYGSRSPLDILTKIQADNPDLEELVLLPLYPHYAMSSYESAVVHVQSAYHKLDMNSEFKVVKPFYNNNDYIKNIAESIKPFLGKRYDHILFSYHGIPVRHVKKTDVTKNHCFTCENCCDVKSEAHKTCYRHQVRVTTNLVANELKIQSDQYSISFQSRLGTDEWLSPNTSDVLKKMPANGIKNLLVISPAFVSDCLETLEELHMDEKRNFLESGGESFHVIPCLNTNRDWIETVGRLILSA